MTNQQAINLLKVLEQSLDDYLEVFGNSEQLPSAQPDHIADVSKKVDADLISRREALEALKALEEKPKALEDDYDFGRRQMLETCIDIIQDLQPSPSAQSEQRWIPCSEMLPKEYDVYRITWTTSASKKRFVCDSEYEITDEWDDKRNDFKGEWLLDDYIKTYPDVKVIAWKTIEEPYAERREE